MLQKWPGIVLIKNFCERWLKRVWTQANNRLHRSKTARNVINNLNAHPGRFCPVKRNVRASQCRRQAQSLHRLRLGARARGGVDPAGRRGSHQPRRVVGRPRTGRARRLSSVWRDVANSLSRRPKPSSAPMCRAPCLMHNGK